jgi:hypothetical protein
VVEGERAAIGAVSHAKKRRGKLMFGVLNGAACAMGPGQRLEWTGHLCGVCLALQGHYGVISRLATNHDAALLSVLYDAQIAQPQSRRLSFCPLRSSFRAEIVTADSPGVRYAASMALVMASAKIRDHLLDNEGGLRLARRAALAVSNRWARAGGETIAGLGLDAGFIEEQIRRQTEVEARPGQGFPLYARPTELAVGAAFGNTAILADRPDNAELLYEMGRMFGRIMVLLDSYQDYVTDVKARSFNALAAAFGEAEWAQQASRIFHQAHSALRECFYQLDLPHPALPRALLVRQLQKRGHRTLQLCSELAPSCPGLGVKTGAARSASLWSNPDPQGEDEQEAEEEEEEQEEEAEEQVIRDRGWCGIAPWCYWCDCSGCDCGDCNCCDCACGNCNCGDCNCGDCS